MFSTDIDSRDFKLHKPEDVIKSVMTQLEKRGKGIILMHDLHHNTAEAVPELIRQLKAGGYKIVHMVPKGELTTVPKYDEMVRARRTSFRRTTRGPKAASCARSGIRFRRRETSCPRIAVRRTASLCSASHGTKT